MSSAPSLSAARPISGTDAPSRPGAEADGQGHPGTSRRAPGEHAAGDHSHSAHTHGAPSRRGLAGPAARAKAAPPAIGASILRLSLGVRLGLAFALLAPLWVAVLLVVT